MAGNNAQRPGIPSEEELSDLSKELGTCWESLGIQLGLGYAMIQNIKGDNVQYPSLPNKVYAMLMKWHDKGRAATYHMLAKALRHEEKQGLAEKYCETNAGVSLTINISGHSAVQMDGTSLPAPSVGEIMRAVAADYRQAFPLNSTENFVNFEAYLERIRLLISDVSVSSLHITVMCTSLEILEDLWQIYTSGALNDAAQRCLVTDKVLKKYNLKQFKLVTTIDEEEYSRCKAQFIEKQEAMDKTSPAKEALELTPERKNSEISEALRRLAGSVSSAKGEEWQQAMAELKTKVPSTIDATRYVENLDDWCNFDEVKRELQDIKEDTKKIKLELGDRSLHTADEEASKCFLPITYRHFVNRVDECQKIKSHLSLQSSRQANLISIIGPPGIGKTSTALKVANDLMASDWEILYVNCRPMRFLDELAHKIGNYFNPHPSDKPISEALHRLCSQTEKTLLVLDNFDNLLYPKAETLKAETSRPSTSTSRSHPNTCSPKPSEHILRFVSDIGKTAKNVSILITSGKHVTFPDLSQERISLEAFGDGHSMELLEKLQCKLGERETEKVLKLGGGIPLMLRSLASIRNPEIITELSSNPPGHFAAFMMNMTSLSDEDNIILRIFQSFERLQPLLQKVLVQLSVFKGPFTMQRAKHILNLDDGQGTVSIHLTNLVDHSLLVETPGSRYVFLAAISGVCSLAFKEDSQLQQTYADAKQRFIHHYSMCLEELFKKFYSMNSLEAIKTYQEEEENIKQLLYWCAEDPSMDDSLRKKCVDTFNKVGELLAKLIRGNEFERIFTKLAEKCQGDNRRVTECWISMGIKIIFSCSCSPKLCDPAKNRAKVHFVKALNAKAHIADNSRAQCLAKLGRCYALEGNFQKGRGLIEQALEIRRKNAHEDLVMLAATYNDLAVAQTLNGQHKEAIQTRRGQTLKVYNEKLGDHPFTATILNNIGNNYHELKKFDSAIKYFKKALEIRKEFLGDHQDTAKSLYDLGIAHNAQGSMESPESREELEKALQYIQQAALMQEKVSDTKEELVKVYRQLVEVLKKLGRDADAQKEQKKVKECEDAIDSRADSRDVCCTSTDQTDVDIH